MQRPMKVPALNTVQLCGSVSALPRQIGGNSPGAVFELTAKAYQPGRKAKTASVRVVCWGITATAVLQRVRQNDVVLIAGALENYSRDPRLLQVEASVVQFLTADDESA